MFGVTSKNELAGGKQSKKSWSEMAQLTESQGKLDVALSSSYWRVFSPSFFYDSESYPGILSFFQIFSQ